MSLSLKTRNFPANDETDGLYLYRSLGSFWTQVFKDKAVLKGYTIGLAEELIQAYVNLAEVIRQFSIKDLDILHTEHWQPLIIKRSEYNKAFFDFSPDNAVFGVQPETDRFYAGKLFRFGQPKQTNATTVFSYRPNFALKDLGLIANRIISPSFFLMPGVDVILDDDVLYFNKDIFLSDLVQRIKLLDDYGNPVIYTDSDGNPAEDEFIILWIYRARIDQSSLYLNFGRIFDIPVSSDLYGKQLLAAVMNLSVDGPSIQAITSFLAAQMHVPVVIEAEETVEQLFEDDSTRYIVTDKNVYKLPSYVQLREDIAVNKILTAGELLSDNIRVLDNVMSRSWWLHELRTKKLALSSHVFAASTKYQLFFENTLRLITFINGRINFPVLGRPEDVEAFHEVINSAENKELLLDKLNISTAHSSRPINPLDFVFENFFKNNTLLISLNFYDEGHIAEFFSNLHILRRYLPPHVYILVYVNLTLRSDTLGELNNILSIDAYSGENFSIDGSVSYSGARPGSAATDDDYYKDYVNRMFCISLGPLRNALPLHHADNLDTLSCNENIVDGSIWTDIPLSVIPPGQMQHRLPSTREIQSILLIDF